MRVLSGPSNVSILPEIDTSWQAVSSTPLPEESVRQNSEPTQVQVPRIRSARLGRLTVIPPSAVNVTAAVEEVSVLPSTKGRKADCVKTGVDVVDPQAAKPARAKASRVEERVMPKD